MSNVVRNRRLARGRPGGVCGSNIVMSVVMTFNAGIVSNGVTQPQAAWRGVWRSGAATTLIGMWRRGRHLTCRASSPPVSMAA